MSTPLKSAEHNISPADKAKQLILFYSVRADFENSTNYEKLIALSHAQQSLNLLISVLISQDVYSSDIAPVYRYYSDVRDIIWEQYINHPR